MTSIKWKGEGVGTEHSLRDRPRRFKAMGLIRPECRNDTLAGSGANEYVDDLAAAASSLIWNKEDISVHAHKASCF
ncbi:hypothetical protein [Rhizobium bangladeshense]|uniref:hypothetical protein n=1 Tax=Rhizobium bangladeshense TaxID=1138189 RepID=UPI0012E9537B|nr:hypothetical protein [Rhizobium bangladeshense]